MTVGGWNSAKPIRTQSGVVRPSEIVVGWNTTDSIDGRPLPTARKPSRPAP
jgi:hypothetical protein